MTEVKFLKAKVAADSLIFSGEEFTWSDLQKKVRDYVGDDVKRISEFTSLKAYLNDLLRRRKIIPLPYDDDGEPKYRMKISKVHAEG